MALRNFLHKSAKSVCDQGKSNTTMYRVRHRFLHTILSNTTAVEFIQFSFRGMTSEATLSQLNNNSNHLSEQEYVANCFRNNKNLKD
ncbi:hypothetical protein Y032_0147g2621 [Ancylostoma ceylanicum]|uniref:Uncharacterized protein n=1 Tax=Ancylostoma ceylanicum TaxID=53326 RepID=A0A016T2K1_9BILA|nr:hypothetical protein Y032_0147g2621 [Ancylostoma ceylanicum]